MEEKKEPKINIEERFIRPGVIERKIFQNGEVIRIDRLISNKDGTVDVQKIL